jgi:hypothetical protein
MQSQFVSDLKHNWTGTVCGPVFQELRACVTKHSPYVKFHDHDSMIEEDFLIDPGKIIVMSQVGDLLEINKFKHIFQSNLEYYKQTGRKKNFFILLTPVEYSQKEIEQYKDILMVCFVPSWYHHYNRIIKINQQDLQDEIQFHFLSFNGRLSLLRTSLFCYFYRKKLLAKSIFSYLGYSAYAVRSNFETLINRGADYYLNSHNFEPDTESHIPSEEIFKLVPYRIKNETVSKGIPVVSNIAVYNQTFCHLVTETYKGHHNPFLTEKTFKPIAAKQPFMLFGAKHSLRFLQDLGFQTFAAFIDESYDSLDQPDRFNAILSEIDRIAAMSIDQLKDLKSEMKSVVDHNYNHLYNRLPIRYAKDIAMVSMHLDYNVIPQQLKYL